MKIRRTEAGRPPQCPGRPRCAPRRRWPRCFCNLQSAICNLPFLVALALAVFATSPLRAQDLRVDLDKPGDAHVKPRIDADGFAVHVEVKGHLDKLQPATIRLDTKQKGEWLDAKLEAGRYLKHDLDAKRPEQVRLESTLRFDMAPYERRFTEERDAIGREAQKRTGGKDPAMTRARTQLMLERIAAIRKENIEAGADPRGKRTRMLPPLPRQALEFEKPEVIERVLRQQCRWQGVAEVFKATGFAPPDDREHPEFSASETMADEIQKALMGVKVPAKFLTDAQIGLLADGNQYTYTVRCVPRLADGAADLLWKTAPGVRLADRLVKRATLEGSLDRAKGQTVAWWRVECDSFPRLQTQMFKGDGDCFWTWVDGPESRTRYIRVLLHSPGTRYGLTLQLGGGTSGEEVTLFDGPVSAPTKGPF